jgi:hypothetical protein
MVGQARVSVAYQHERRFDMASLRRLAIWGGAATVALLLAVVAGYSDANSRRLMAADAQNAVAPTAQLASRLPEIEAQTQRLAGVVDGLAADRERLTARIGTIERSLEDVTGAIRRQGADSHGAASAALPAPSQPVATLLPAPVAKEAAQESGKQESVKQESAKDPVKGVTMAPAPGPLDILAARQPGAAAEAHPASPEAFANLPAIRSDEAAATELSKVEFGVDVGGAINFDGLRVLWTSTKGSNAALFEGLHPVVAVRENSRTKNAELRLVVGPLAHVEGAARLCAILSAARRYCQPVSFEGQRLAEPDAVPERRAAPPAPKPKVVAPAPPPPKPRGLFP